MLCTDVIFDHVLPKCSIDTRLAFRIPPRKLDMATFEASLVALAWKYGPMPVRVGRPLRPHHYRQYVPLWQFGTYDDGFPKEYIFICIDTILRKHPGSTLHLVQRSREDHANIVGGDFDRVIVHPTPYTLQYGSP
jgi:hypothetical protein